MMHQGTHNDTAEGWMHEAVRVAGSATCTRARCGTVIVQGGRVIGEGFNSPPRHREDQRFCAASFDGPPKKNYDRTCCVHAEQRAIFDALKRNPDAIIGSRLYFIRIDDDGKPKMSGKPYCTVCSRLALEAGIAEFVLWHDDGIRVYPTDEYNQLSYQYKPE